MLLALVICHRYCLFLIFISMPRIGGVDIPDKKRIEIALTYIYGIGLQLARKILATAEIDGNKRTSDLSTSELSVLREIIQKNYTTEGELRRKIMMDIKRLRDVNCWRGMRHGKKLPVRGQKTKTNTRTVRGNVRKTVGSGKRAASTPT